MFDTEAAASPCSTAADPTSSSRMSSRTPTTRPSRSSPSSPAGEEADDDISFCFFPRLKLISVFFFFLFLCVSVVKAGTELTWDYSSDVERKQDVPCLCGCSVCKGHFAIEEKLCELCETEEEA